MGHARIEVTDGDELAQREEDLPCLLNKFIELNGRHEETRTPDLYRVEYAVNKRARGLCNFYADPELADCELQLLSCERRARRNTPTGWLFCE